MAFAVRQMKPEDWPQVSRIYQQGLEAGNCTFYRECPTYQEWDSRYIKECRLVMAEQEQVAGWCALQPVSSKPAYCGLMEPSIYLDSQYRGQGLGVRLMQEMIRYSEEHGFWGLQSCILANNPASVALHEKCGFRRIGRREKSARDINGIWQDTILMEKRSQLPHFQ